MRDLKNCTFGRWCVLGPAKPRKGQAYWTCQCSCAERTIRDVCEYSLLKGLSQSCGCIHREEVRQRMTKHGQERTRLYRIWKAMKWRCDCPSGKTYSYYQGKGIQVCAEWREFLPFYDWAIANGYRDNLTIDRIDNSKGYEPDNCRWVTYRAQANNKTNNRRYEHGAETKTLQEWSEDVGMKYTTLVQRLNRGWSFEKAITTPVRKVGGEH